MSEYNVTIALNRSKNARLNKEELEKIYSSPAYDLVVFDDKETDTQGYMYCVHSGNMVFIAFRGTQQIKDWLTDLNAFHMDYPYGNKDTKIRVHRGIMGAYKSVRNQIDEYLIKHKPTIVNISGHSLGGAIATLCAVDVQYNWKNVMVICFPSGNPMVGNKAFCESYDKRVPNTIRTYIRSDIVPSLPPRFLQIISGQFSHCGIKNPIGPKNPLLGLTRWIKYKFARDESIADDLTNHDIDLYKKYM